MSLETDLRGPALNIPEEKAQQHHIPQVISENIDRPATLGNLDFILQAKGNGEDSTQALVPHFLELISSSLFFVFEFHH